MSYLEESESIEELYNKTNQIGGGIMSDKDALKLRELLAAYVEETRTGSFSAYDIIDQIDAELDG